MAKRKTATNGVMVSYCGGGWHPLPANGLPQAAMAEKPKAS